jgi:hypothetical protein
VRQNAVEALRSLEPLTMDRVKITVASEIYENLHGRPLQPVDMKLAASVGAVPYLKQRRVSAFFADPADQLNKKYLLIGTITLVTPIPSTPLKITAAWLLFPKISSNPASVGLLVATLARRVVTGLGAEIDLCSTVT